MISPKTEKWDLHFTISQGAKTPSLSWHTSMSVRKHLISLCNWKNYQDIRVTLTILGNWTFILLYSKVPNPSAWSDTPLDTIQAATIWSLEMGNIWKKSQNITKTNNTEKRVTHSTILRGVEIPHPQWDTDNNRKSPNWSP